MVASSFLKRKTNRGFALWWGVVLLFCVGASLLEVRQVWAESLVVDTSKVLNSIKHEFLGVNYVGFWDSVQGSAKSSSAFKNANLQVFRFPGGAPALWYDWAAPYADGWSSTSTTDLWRYGQGARLLLQTNNTTNHNNDPSAAHVAAWVKYVQTNGIEVPYWEIGNEPEINAPTTTSGDYDWTHFQLYVDRFNEQAQAIKTQDSAAKVFGPSGTNTWYWWAQHSLEMFLEKTGNRHGSGLVDGVTVHWYPAPDWAGWGNVVGIAQQWASQMSYIKSVIAAKDTRNLPVFISECNAVAGLNPGEITMTLASALANADMIGAFRDSGVQGVQLFGSIHYVSNSYGLLYGSGDARAADSPTPTYYILPIWSKAGSQVVSVTGATSPSDTLSAYGSMSIDGSVQVVVINKTSVARSVDISLAGTDLNGRTVLSYQLKPKTTGGGAVWDKDVYYNNTLMPDPSLSTGLPLASSAVVSAASYATSVPGYSLTLFDFRPALTKPTIVTQPKSLTVGVGASATFRIEARGTAPLSYRWLKNDIEISGATDAVYTIPSAKLSDNGSRFSCIVSNSAGFVKSNDAVLTVDVMPPAPPSNFKVAPPS